MSAKIVAAIALGLLAGDSKPVVEEQGKFEGSWRYESMTVEGKTFPALLFEKSRLNLKGNQFELVDSMGTYKGTYKVDPVASPKTIDVTFVEGPHAGQTSQGIYELDGDTYKVCIGLAGKDRPKAFASEAGSGHVLQVLKRVKP